MPGDLTALRQSELLQLVNGTPLGTVLSRSKLRRQMDAAGQRIGDGHNLHLLKYVRWLILEHERPTDAPIGYDEARQRQASRQRAATKAAQDVGPIPDVEDWTRRTEAIADLRTFYETYFPEAFFWGWSRDHLESIATLQQCIQNGGLFAFAMYRAGGKTTMTRIASLWATLGDYTPYVCAISGTADYAVKQLLDPTKLAILENHRLLADFPEALHPLRALENSSKRQKQQHVNGHLTHVRWEVDRIVYPSIMAEDLPPSFADRGLERGAAFGAVMSVTGLDSHIRGQQHTRPDGKVIRPRLVLLDDPQTRDSARSPYQTGNRLDLINGDVLGLAGHDESIAAVCLCTKIYQRDLTDLLLDPDESPDWQTQCTRLVEAFPTNDTLWEKYGDIRRRRIQAHNAKPVENAFYRRHRKAMDADAKVSWPECFNRRNELSAIQHAMNLKLRNEATFYAEYQNDPQTEQDLDDVLTIAQVLAKFNGRKRGTVPLDAPTLTAHVDVHDKVLYYAVTAWAEDFTGYLIDYGTHPEQGRARFHLHKAPHTLRGAYPGRGADGAITAGLEELVARLLAREWTRTGGGVVRIARLLVDAGYKPRIVAAVKHKTGGDTMMLSRGVGITAGRKPISEYRRKPGEKHGHHWYTPSVRGTSEFPHVLVDTNYWKSFLHARLAMPAGEIGCLSLFGRSGRPHELLAEHVVEAESWTETAGHGRTVREWKLRPNKPDNHWLDCLVGCLAAASMQGVQLPGMKAPPGQKPRKRYTQSDMTRRNR